MAKSKNKGGTAKEKAHDPYTAFNFTIEIEGLTVGGFSEVEGLGGKLELESYVEGGMNHRIHYFPKYMSYPTLTLIRGLADRDDLWKWYEDTTRGKIQLLNGTITLNNCEQSKVMAWNFKKAYPIAWSGPKFNAVGSEIAFEQLELVHRGVYRA